MKEQDFNIFVVYEAVVFQDARHRIYTQETYFMPESPWMSEVPLEASRQGDAGNIKTAL